MCWELCNVETAFGSVRFVTVVLGVVNTFFVETLVVASSLLTVVVNEGSVGSGGVCEDWLLIVPLGDVPTVDFSKKFSDFAAADSVGTVVFAAEIVDEFNTGVVAVPASMLSSLLQSLDRRQRTVT